MGVVVGRGEAERVVASTDEIVFDPNIGIHRQVVAGAVVPFDLVDAYREAGGEVVGEIEHRSTRKAKAKAGATKDDGDDGEKD